MTTTGFPITYSQLVGDFKALGVAPGQIVMLHASIKAVGDIVGGPNVIIQSLLEALTPAGTLMMYAGWNDQPDGLEALPPELRQLYYDQHPAFDPQTARSARGYGLLVEILRTWPGVQRSLNPEASMVAVGARAEWMTSDHPMNYGYGKGSPLAKLVESHGRVLMLGAPLDALTLLHFAENRARMCHKNIVRYQCPVIEQGEKVWLDVEDFNTGDAHDDYTLGDIARDYLVQRKVCQAKIGCAQSWLFDATDLTAFAVEWLESRFGENAD